MTEEAQQQEIENFDHPESHISSSESDNESDEDEQWFEAPENFVSLEDVSNNIDNLKGDLDLHKVISSSEAIATTETENQSHDPPVEEKVPIDHRFLQPHRKSASEGKDSLRVEPAKEPRTLLGRKASLPTSIIERPSLSNKNSGDRTEAVRIENKLLNKAKGTPPQGRNYPLRSVLSDNEILKAITVKNLDTGDSVSLAEVDKILPRSTSPLDKELIRRTSELSLGKLARSKEKLLKKQNTFSPSGSPMSGKKQHVGVSTPEKSTLEQSAPRRRSSLLKQSGKKVKMLFGKLSHISFTGNGGHDKDSKGKGQPAGISSDRFQEKDLIKVKTSNKKHGEFCNLRFVQDLNVHSGAIWCLRFSCCGNLLATAGSDTVIRVWIVKDREEYFLYMRAKYNNETINQHEPSPKTEDGEKELLFKKVPFCTFVGHTADILDLTWSKNHFLLSSSMDKSVRLWHIAREECLGSFQHSDFVTAISFHPQDDRYFLSGSLDSKLRLWSIPEKKVSLWNAVGGAEFNLITAASFCLNGKLCVAGTYDGRCLFYDSEKLKYHTQIQVKGKRRKAKKISGIIPMPGEDRILVTANDSRIRLYDLKEHSLLCKYKGFSNSGSQISASFSADGRYIICGSEDSSVVIWNSAYDETISKSRRFRNDRNSSVEYYNVHSTSVTAAIFAPYSTHLGLKTDCENAEGEVVISADYGGNIVVLQNCAQDKVK